MRPSDRTLFLGAVLSTIALCPVPAQADIQHWGELDYDKTIGCEAAALGKRVLWFALRTEQVMVPCPASKSELIKSLSEKGVTVAVTGEWAFLLPSHPDNSSLERFTPEYKHVEPSKLVDGTNKLVVRWTTKNFAAPGIPGSRTLSESELKEVETKILHDGRLIPVEEPISRTGVFEIPLELTVDCHRLSPKSPESVVATLQERPVSNPGRLYYGEFRNGHFELLWDSPIIHARLLHMGYMDVDGDGIQEILLNSFAPGNVTFPAVAVLDRKGNELTRQNECDITGLELYGADEHGADTVCPILGEDFRLLDPVNGKRDLAVGRLEYQGSGTQIFRLQGGRYAVWPPPDTSKSKARAVELNEKGMKEMNEEGYGMAVGYFTDAALSDSATALYPNNAGFAYYKRGLYQESAIWFRKAIAVDPKRPIAYLNLGDALAKLNRNADARDAYKKYLELAPDSKAAPDAKKKLDGLPDSP